MFGICVVEVQHVRNSGTLFEKNVLIFSWVIIFSSPLFILIYSQSHRQLFTATPILPLVEGLVFISAIAFVCYHTTHDRNENFMHLITYVQRNEQEHNIVTLECFLGVSIESRRKWGSNPRQLNPVPFRNVFSGSLNGDNNVERSQNFILDISEKQCQKILTLQF